MKGFFVIVITAIVMGWLAASARNTKARRVNDGWLFPPVRAILAIFAAFLLMSGFFIFFGYRAPRTGDHVVGMSVGLLFAVFGCVMWPKSIEVSQSMLRQRSWWGGWKVIRWEDITSAEERQDKCIVVRARHARILLSPYHAGRELFLDQLRAHSSFKTVGRKQKTR